MAMAAAACTGAVGAHGQPAASGKGGAHRYVRDLETAYDVDVFVAGGVPSGVAAAVTAARCGAKVFLAESAGGRGCGTKTRIYIFCADAIE